MDVLNTTALPQSTEHFHLLLLVYNIVMAFLFPYLALVVGSMVTSVVLDRRAMKKTDAHLGSLARRLAGIALPDRSTFLFLAVLPAVAVVFLFVQMFQGTPAASAGFAALGAIFLIAGGIAGFAYKLTFTIDDVITLARSGRSTQEEPSGADQVAAFVTSTRISHRRAANWSAVLLIVSTLFISGASTIGFNPGLWRSVDGLAAFLLSGRIWVDMIAVVASAAGMTGTVLLFSRFVWHAAAVPAGEDALLRRYGIALAAVGILAMPLAFLPGAMLTPAASLSGWTYVLLGVSFALLALSMTFLYAFVQSGRRIFVSLCTAMIVIALVLTVTRNQVALHTATRDHAAILAAISDRQTADLRSSLGIKGKQLTGEDIFNAKCSACHMFDAKKVGPPYKEVLPKYSGRKNALVAFVLNPMKVDPAYPSMPAQGLKPAEADSIATYLLDKVGVKGQ